MLDKYKKLTDIEHVLTRTGVYLGAIANHTTDCYIIEDGKAVKKRLTYNPALLKMFDEIISNSVDEHIKHNAVTSIEVNISKLAGSIEVKDNGGIPVVKHPDYNQWIPEMIFGELRSGTNFDDDDRPGAGQNGMGSTLVNIFSTEFKVRTCDGKKEFIQIYKDNLSHQSSPSVRPDTNHGTTITFTPDYKRLDCSLDDDNYNKLVKRVYDVAGCNPLLKVYLNGELLKINNFKQYIELFSDTYVYDKSSKWEIGLTPSSDDTFEHVSFINGVDTYVGGTHIDYIGQQIIAKIREHIKKKNKIDIKPNNIKQQLRLFINGYINAPQFDSQTKSNMTSEVKTYQSEWEPSTAFIKKVLESSVVENILAWALNEQEKQERAELRKLTKKKKAHKSDKYFPATKNQHILFAAEGQSAIGGLIPSVGRDQFGYYELKGKPLNCMNATVAKFKDNKELADLYSVLASEDYDYFITATDQDLDGMHIRLLLASFVIEYVPEYKGKFGYLDTPVIVIKKKGKIVRWYYSLRDDIKLGTGEELQYYKGLGTFNSKDLKYIIEQDGLENMIKLFDFRNMELYYDWLKEDKVERRKELLLNHRFSIANL